MGQNQDDIIPAVGCGKWNDPDQVLRRALLICVNWPLPTNLFNQVTPCKEIQDIIGFWIYCRVFWIPGTGFRILGQWNLDSWFNFSWYSLSCFLDSNAHYSWKKKKKFTEFQNPVSGLPSMWQNHVKEKHLLLGSALCSTQCYVCSSHYSYPIFN